MCTGYQHLGGAETHGASRGPSGTLQPGPSETQAAPRALLQAGLRTYLTAPGQAPAPSPASPQQPAGEKPHDALPSPCPQAGGR